MSDPLFDLSGKIALVTGGSRGLGVQMVRAFAELHGGRMIIKSVVGEGTAVTVRMPVIVAVAAAETPPSPAEPEPPRRAMALGENVIAFTPQR